MIHYHGTPITPASVAIEVLTCRHAMVSFAYPDQMELVAEVCQSFVLDNGAFSVWKAGRELDVPGFFIWRREWHRHPGFDWAIIPDSIEGNEADNDALMEKWLDLVGNDSDVPVWHLHESIDRLLMLCNRFRRVAFGSSGRWADPGSNGWWNRMGEALNEICEDGRPITKLHGLRMLDPTIFSQIPFASADSCNVAINIGYDKRWKGTYQPATLAQRAMILAGRIEHHASAARWTQSYGTQKNLELIG